MTARKCTHCGAIFEARFENLTLCPDCYRKRAQAFELLAAAEREVEHYKALFESQRDQNRQLQTLLQQITQPAASGAGLTQ